MPEYTMSHTGAQLDAVLTAVLAGQAGLQGVIVNNSEITPDGNNKVSLTIPTLAQSTGSSTTSSMSQNAITSALGGKANVTYYTATLAANSWSGTTSNFTQTVTVDGITATDHPIIDLSEPTASNLDSWSYVSKAESGNNSITFTCFSYMPTVDLGIIIAVVK